MWIFVLLALSSIQDLLREFEFRMFSWVKRYGRSFDVSYVQITMEQEHYTTEGKFVTCFRSRTIAVSKKRNAEFSSNSRSTLEHALRLQVEKRIEAKDELLELKDGMSQGNDTDAKTNISVQKNLSGDRGNQCPFNGTEHKTSYL